MTPVRRLRRPVIVAVASLLVVGVAACGRKHPPGNTQSDFIAFSRVEPAWSQSRGAGAIVAVIDWQFDPRADVAARFVSPATMVPGEQMGDLKPWHGAWMVEIVHRVAPEAGIMPIIGRSLKQSDYQAALVAGIRYAADHGAVAVTSSMGPATDSPQLREAVAYAEARGTLFVNVHPENVAADPKTFQPCGADACDRRIVHAGVVSVPEHAVTPNPARDVYTWPYDFEAKFQDGWGFSNAPPIVGGVIALVKSANPRLSPAEIRELLVRTAYEREGFRVLDANAAVREAVTLKLK